MHFKQTEQPLTPAAQWLQRRLLAEFNPQKINRYDAAIVCLVQR